MTFDISQIAYAIFSYLADYKIKLITYDLENNIRYGELIVLGKKILKFFASVIIGLSILITGCSSPGGVACVNRSVRYRFDSQITRIVDDTIRNTPMRKCICAQVRDSGSAGLIHVLG